MEVLVADDDPMVRYLLEGVARSLGHEVRGVEDGDAAWSALEGTAFPLVILDWEMPGIDGLELCRRLRSDAARRDTFVLLVTGRAESDDLVRALEVGVDDYLAKPVSPEHLRARLTIAVERIRQTRARRAAESALARAQRLAGIGETTLALQHEINNPLAALMGHAELLALARTAEQRKEHIAVILEQVRRIADVVRRLSELQEPRSVDYVAGSRMIDLTGSIPEASASGGSGDGE